MIATRRSASIFRTTIIAGFAVLIVIAVAGYIGSKLISNPFTTQTVDRTPPPVLKDLHEVSEYRAASAEYEALIDIEKDVKYIPEFLAGEHTLFVGIGSVDAYVDFADLGEDAVETSFDGTEITITLPHARLAPPRLDASRSYVADRDRGLIDRVSGMFEDSPTSERELYIAAEAKLAEAAAASKLLSEAEKNTSAMLTELMEAAGFESVTVNYDGVSPKETPLP